MAEFFLDILDLLLQEVFALLLIKIHSCLLTYLLLEFQQLSFAVKYLKQTVSPFFCIINFKQFHLVFDAERQRAAHIVDRDHFVLNARQSKLCLVGHVFIESDILFGALFHRFANSDKLLFFFARELLGVR